MWLIRLAYVKLLTRKYIVLSSYSYFPKGISLVVKTDGSVNTVADLKGKKIALQKGTILHEERVTRLVYIHNMTSPI